ncbi:stress responsive A/B barrel domain-containing protein [Suillus plorans]|uniref:Stress responsive A/B barrel domain-containing protein n=1 Tax=Suillus plorans TaxID=116603 RepID=A0A9P7DGU3_9AGAM|nr:stress responsive A/B barrel domain-containing protein [Suillus plorans]KAG1792916.1 stress responsive A/B barrel domain-containing protein [Suillus plorans]
MTIHHIVLYKFKPEVTPEQKQGVRDSVSALLSQIPAIQSIITGETVYNHLGHGFDEGVIFLFESQAKLNEYRSHKAHIDYQGLAKPLTEGLLIFDIESSA